MLQFKTILITVLFAVSALAQQGEDCPNRATDCPDNCGGAQCPRFLNAECRVNPCHGLCTPNFFRENGRNVTHRCDVERCDEKDCPGKRQCIEEIIPASCPGNGSCRQYIKSRCVLPPPPTDCSQITCGPGMYCREKKGGIGVKCALARNCNQLTCSEGLSCSETAVGPVCMDEEPTPSTIIMTSAPTVEVTTPFPNFCDFCASLGQVCQVVNGSYQCTQPTECNSVRINYCLNTFGQLCKEVNGTAECVFADSCNDIDCPRGTMCEEFGFAFCNPVTTAETCEQLNCEFLPGQVCEQRNDSAVCVVGCNADLTAICERTLGRCEVVNGIPECILPSTCDEIECGDGLRCIVVEGDNVTQDLVICVEVKQTCEGVVCAGDEVCIQVSLPSRNFSLAECLASQITESFPTIEEFMCTGSPTPLCQTTEICTDVFQNDLFVTFSCNNFTTDCVDDTSCALNEVCTDVPNDLGVTVPFTKICLPTDETIFEFGGSCAPNSKQCPTGLVCQDIALEGVSIGTSCGVPSPVQVASSCTELEVQCQAPRECVGYLVAGKGGLAQCVDEATADDLFQIFMPLFRVQ